MRGRATLGDRSPYRLRRPARPVVIVLAYAGREYRLSFFETILLAGALTERAALSAKHPPQPEDVDFGPAAQRVSDAVSRVPVVAPVDYQHHDRVALEAHEAAAIALAAVDVHSRELARFRADYVEARDNGWRLPWEPPGDRA
jgi:hypothetical protein